MLRTRTDGFRNGVVEPTLVAALGRCVTRLEEAAKGRSASGDHLDRLAGESSAKGFRRLLDHEDREDRAE